MRIPMPPNPLIAAGPAPWYRQYRARGYLHGAPAHSRATAALGTGCPSWTGVLTGTHGYSRALTGTREYFMALAGGRRLWTF
jgi:hypothetical protein